jgi:hypothetical protein
MTFGTFTPVQWIAFVIAAITLLKLLIVMFNKKKWFDMTSTFYNNGKTWSWILLLVSFGLLYYLLQELSIVQIIAVVGFVAALGGFAAMQYSNELLPLIKKIMKKNFSGTIWLYILIWLALVLWALKELFGY